MRGKGTTAHGTIALLDEASARSIHVRAAILAANHKDTAAKIAALQFPVIDQVRPILPPFDQSRAHRIFPDIEPIWTPKIHPFAANDRRFHPAISSLRGSD